MARQTGNKALAFIFVTLLIDVMGIGIIIPVLPKLIMSLQHCTIEEATMTGGYLMFIYSFMQFFFSPLLGALSDRFGRRPVLLISLFGFGIDYLFLGFAGSISLLFIGRLIAGITGASFTVAGAYIADISPPEKRAANFGIIGAAFGLGFIAGPALGAAIGQFGERIPFFAAAGLSLLNWLYGYFILPESLKLENRRKFEWKRANPLGAFRQMIKRPMVAKIALLIFIANLAGQVLPSTWPYYTMERYGWTEKGVGLSLAYVGILVAIVQGGLTRVLIPKIGEYKAIVVGMTLNTIGLLGIGLATNQWILLVANIPLAMGGLGGPSLQSMASKQIAPNEQGELQGFLASAVSITAILGPLLFPWLFHTFSSGVHSVYAPGAPYFCAALLLLSGLFFAIVALKKKES